MATSLAASKATGCELLGTPSRNWTETKNARRCQRGASCQCLAAFPSQDKPQTQRRTARSRRTEARGVTTPESASLGQTSSQASCRERSSCCLNPVAAAGSQHVQTHPLPPCLTPQPKSEKWEPRSEPRYSQVPWSSNPRGDAHFCWSVGFWMIVFSPSITCCFSWCDSIPAAIREPINTSELRWSLALSTLRGAANSHTNHLGW